MRTFKSQIDGIIFYPQLVAATSVMLYSLWVGYVVLWILSMLWAVFLIAKIIGTEYVILDDGTLCLRSGYLSSRRIAVTEIKSICTRQNNKAIFSSYVLSRRNVMLCLSNDKRPIRLSPKESEAFVSELLRRNPHIEIIDNIVQRIEIHSEITGSDRHSAVGIVGFFRAEQIKKNFILFFFG